MIGIEDARLLHRGEIGIGQLDARENSFFFRPSRAAAMVSEVSDMQFVYSTTFGTMKNVVLGSRAHCATTSAA